MVSTIAGGGGVAGNNGQPGVNGQPSLPKPPNPILKYDKCATNVQNQANHNHELLDIMSATTMGSAAGACAFTGPGFLYVTQLCWDWT